MATTSSELWLGSYNFVKLGSRSTIPTFTLPNLPTTTTDGEENYTVQLNDTYNSQSTNGYHSGTLVLVGVFVCTFLQVFPLALWWLGWDLCVRWMSRIGQHVLMSSLLPTCVRKGLIFCISLGIGEMPSLSTSTTLPSKNTTPTPPTPQFEVLPQHIAIIMDGNRRYGKEMYGDAGRGHAEGGRTLSRVIDFCLEFHVQALTVYAFSTENWNREQAEIDLLMDIFVTQADEILHEAKSRNVQVKILSSDPMKLPMKVQQKFKELEEVTRLGTNMTLNLCVSYGGRGDIVNACRSVTQQVLNGTIATVEDITEDVLSNNVLTGDCKIPDPDLLIRTSGERRLSNFLLWQIAYSEFIFLEKHWPAVNREDLLGIFTEYSRRKRRFGK